MIRLNFLLFILIPSINYCQKPRLVLPIGHSNPINIVEFNSKGNLVMTASLGDETVKIWNAENGRLLNNFTGHISNRNSSHFNPDGTRIIIGSNNNAQIWNVITGQLVRNFIGHNSNIVATMFSPDGTQIVTASDDDVIKIWKTSGELVKTLLFKKNIKYILYPIQDPIILFSPDGSKIATSANDYNINIWDAFTGQIYKTLVGHTDYVQSLSFSSDGKKILTSSRDNTAKIWDASSGNLLKTLKSKSRELKSTTFSPDGKRAIILSEGHLSLWDTVNDKILQTVPISNYWGNGAQISPDGSMFVAATDSKLQIWDMVTRQLISNLHQSENDYGYTLLRFSPDGKKILAGSADRTATIWDVKTGQPLQSFSGIVTRIEHADVSANVGKIIADHFSPKRKINITNIWDINTGRILHTVQGGSSLYSAQFSYNGDFLSTCDNDSVRIWNVGTGKLLYTFEGQTSYTKNFSADNQKIVTMSYGADNVWDLNTGNRLYAITGKDINLGSALFSPDGTKIITITVGETEKIWDASSGKLLYDLEESSPDQPRVEFSPQSDKVAISYRDNYYNYRDSSSHATQIWDVKTGKILHTLKNNSLPGGLRFSSDGSKIIVVSNDNIKVWNMANGQLITKLDSNPEGVMSATFDPTCFTDAIFDPTDSIIITSANDHVAKIWDAKDFKLIRKIDLGYNAYLVGIDFIRHQLVASNNNELSLINFTSGKKIVSLIAVDSAEYISLTPQGYYQCTKAAAKLLYYVTKDIKFITFEQLDIKYNRPDKVLEIIECSDTLLMYAYREAYLKRIKKLEIDTIAFRDDYEMPECDFRKRDSIGNKQKDKEIEIDVRAFDSSYQLDRFNIWINEVPVFGQKGLFLRRRGNNQFDTCVTIILSEGQNRIETAIRNVNGIESYRSPIYINYAPANPEKGKLYFIGIGISRFADTNNNLAYSTKDIRDLVQAFKQRYGNDCVIDTLMDEQVTIENVRYLKSRLLKTNVEDRVIVAYSGHGLLSSSFDYFLSAYGVDFNKPELAGLPYDDLESLLDSIPARKKLMLIDACHSGEFDKEDLERSDNAADSLGFKKQDKGVKPVRRKGQLSLKSSFELMQSLFVNVSRGTGATVIAAAGGLQLAKESNTLENGVFTYSILEAFQKNKTLKVSQLKNYVNERVTSLTGGLQQPTTRSETGDFDWEIW